MRVLFVSEALESRTGPAARVLGFCTAIEEAGHHVVLVSPGRSDSDTVTRRLRVIQYRAPTRVLRYAGMVSGVLRMFREFRPQVLQVTSYYAPILIPLARMLSVPSVSDYHASLRAMERSFLIHLANAVVEERTLETADLTIVPTRLLSLYLFRRYGRNSVVVPNCIDLRDFRPVDSRSAVFRELEIPDGAKVIFFHGSPYPENLEALSRLTKMVEEMNDRGVPTVALVAGALPAASHQSVRFLGYKDDLATYISAADLAMLPVTISEMGVRSRVVEYLACGLPVVTTPSGATGMDEAVRRGFVLVGKHDVELIGAARSIFALDRNENKKLRGETRRFAEEKFAPSRAARQLEELYRAMIMREGS